MSYHVCLNEAFKFHKYPKDIYMWGCTCEGVSCCNWFPSRGFSDPLEQSKGLEVAIVCSSHHASPLLSFAAGTTLSLAVRLPLATFSLFSLIFMCVLNGLWRMCTQPQQRHLQDPILTFVSTLAALAHTSNMHAYSRIKDERRKTPP